MMTEENSEKETKQETASKKPNLIYAALFLNSMGKKIDEQSVKKIADSAGAKIEDAQVKALVAALDGVDIDEAISRAAMPVAAAPVAAQQAAPAEKEKANEEEQEKKAEEAAEGLGALFG